MHFIKTSVLLFVFCSQMIFSQTIASVPDYSPLINKYRTVIADQMRQNNIAGVSVALVDKDSVVWCEGFGIYDTTHRTSINGHTPLLIGSITKTFTGLAIMQLFEKGLLDLDAPVRKYLPEFKMKTLSGNIDDITIRHLMTHHAGIPDFMKDKFGYNNKYFTEVLSVVNEDYATYPPNTVYSYTNTGISLLGNIIERVSGKSYYDYIRNNIMIPAEMNESGFFLDNTAPLSSRLGYSLNMEEKPELPVFDAPAGCIYSSAYDMAKFISVFLSKGNYNGRRIAGASVFDEIEKIQNKDIFLDFGSPTGLIWYMYFNSAGKCIQHEGSTLYSKSELSVSPDCGLGVVMLTNSAGGKQMVLHTNYDIMEDAIKIKGIKPEKKEQPPVKNILHPQHNRPYSEVQKPRPVSMTREELSMYAGKYASFGMHMEISVTDSNCLSANIMGQKFYMLPVDNDEFCAAKGQNYNSMNPGQRFYFENFNGSRLLISVDPQNNHSVLSEKALEISLSKIWADRLGSYDTDCEPGSHQTFSDPWLEYRDGLLMLVIKTNMEKAGAQQMVIPLRILDDSTAAAYGYGRFGGSKVQFGKNESGRYIMKILGFRCTKK